MNLPFSIDRSSRIKLPYQVADGLRAAIQCGVYKPGERLPSSREMRDALGCSIRAPSEALQILAKEGLITLREKCGAVVSADSAARVNGRVLLIVPGGAQIRCAMVFVENVRRRLNAAGYLTATTSVLREKKFIDGDPDPYDLSQLWHELKIPYSLVLLFGSPPSTNGILQLLARSKHPFLVASGPADAAVNCIGGIECDASAAVSEFVGRCRRAKVKRVAIVRKWRRDGARIAAALREAGVKVEFLTVPQRKGRGRVEALWHSALGVFERQFERHGRTWLPDLIFFTDDNCLHGAVVSLLSRGVRVPRDVRIVTSTNAGMRPPFTCSVACLEHDLNADAEVVSKAMLDFLAHGRRVEGGRTIGCAYVPGETFPAGDFGIIHDNTRRQSR